MQHSVIDRDGGEQGGEQARYVFLVVNFSFMLCTTAIDTYASCFTIFVTTRLFFYNPNVETDFRLLFDVKICAFF